MAAAGAYAAMPCGFAFAAEAAGGGLPVPSAAQREIYKGSCVGHKHIARFDKTEASALRLSVAKSAATPFVREFSAYCN